MLSHPINISSTHASIKTLLAPFFSSIKSIYCFKECKRKRQGLSMRRIARSKLIQAFISNCSVIANYQSIHVRWPAKNSGAFVFGCLFLCGFYPEHVEGFFWASKRKDRQIASRQKDRKTIVLLIIIPHLIGLIQPG